MHREVYRQFSLISFESIILWHRFITARGRVIGTHAICFAQDSFKTDRNFNVLYQLDHCSALNWFYEYILYWRRKNAGPGRSSCGFEFATVNFDATISMKCFRISLQTHFCKSFIIACMQTTNRWMEFEFSLQKMFICSHTHRKHQTVRKSGIERYL